MVLFLLQACGSVSNFRRGNIYDSRVFAFEQAIRWGDYEKADSFVNRRTEEPKTLDLAYLEKIKVTKFRKIKETRAKMDIDDEVVEIHSVYDVEFYVDSINVLKTFRYPSVWWYHPERDTWFLDSDLPDFGG